MTEKHLHHSTWNKTKTDLVQLDLDLQRSPPNSKLRKLIEKYVREWGHWKILPRGKPYQNYGIKR